MQDNQCKWANISFQEKYISMHLLKTMDIFLDDFFIRISKFMLHSLKFCLNIYDSLYQQIETDVMSVTDVQ